jgi:hypothetical protein
MNELHGKSALLWSPGDNPTAQVVRQTILSAALALTSHTRRVMKNNNSEGQLIKVSASMKIGV